MSTKGLFAVGAVIVGMGVCEGAHGQLWGFVSETTDLYSEAYADCREPPELPCHVFNHDIGMVAGWLGADYGFTSHAECRGGFVGCACPALGRSQVTLRGMGTPDMRFEGSAVGIVRHNCPQQHTPPPYLVIGRSDYQSLVTLEIEGVAPETEVEVSWRIDAFSAVTDFDEAGAEDVCFVVLSNVEIIGVAPGFPAGPFIVFPALKDIPDGPGGMISLSLSGTFTITTPATGLASISFYIGVGDAASWGVQSLITPPPLSGVDREWALNRLILRASLDGPVGALDYGDLPPGMDAFPAEPFEEFSVDTGSPSCLYHPGLGPAASVLDPGDVYPVGLPPLPVGGADGMRDDAVMFAGGLDPIPFPTPGFPPPIPAPFLCSGAPFGTPGGPSDPAMPWFDRRDHDVTEFMLSAIAPGLAPLPAPIARFPSIRVYRPDYGVASYNDDNAADMTSVAFGPEPCPTPPGSSSPGGGVYGSPPTEDEAFGLAIIPMPGLALVGLPPMPPLATAVTYAYRSEDEVTANMAPSPPPVVPPGAPQFMDDDVDGYDIIADMADVPDVVYFTASPEAAGGFIPGFVYQSSAAGVALVADPARLGFPFGTAIDALEWAWLEPPFGGGDALALVFSVPPDNPLTPPDDSGGLDPNVLYVSWLMGPALLMPLAEMADDVDAVAFYGRPLGTATTPEPACPADINTNMVTDVPDIFAFLGLWFGGVAPGDPYTNCAGAVWAGVPAIFAFLADWFAGCPCP